jgi:hypothetical protein
VRVRGLDFGSIGAKSLSAQVASVAGGASIELHLGSPTGTVIGTCAVRSTGGAQVWSPTMGGIPDLLSSDGPKIQGNSRSCSGRSELASELSKSEANVLGAREQVSLEQAEVEQVQHSRSEARHELAPEWDLGRSLGGSHAVLQEAGLDAVAHGPLGAGLAFGGQGRTKPKRRTKTA